MQLWKIGWNRFQNYFRKESTQKKECFVINFKYLKIKYKNNGEFFYSYHRRKFIRTGIFTFSLPVKFKALITSIRLNLPFKSGYQKKMRPFILGGFVVLMIISTYYIFRSPDFMEELKEIDAVGGFGEINPKDVFSKVNRGDHANLEIDEKVKDHLLGISSINSHVLSTSEKDKNSDKIAYKVQAGDTLSQISQKFNISVESIAGSSGVNAPDAISVGQTLNIPPKNGFYYKVKKNDRLSSILSKYKLELDIILAENLHIDPDLLEQGDEIFLLGAKPKNLIYGWLIPVTNRTITSGYGWRNWPRKAFHKGLDLKAYYTNVRAAKPGRIYYSGRLGGYGKAVVIEHSRGYRTLYAHLSKIYVRKGNQVIQGRIIGKSGNTGYSFGPHLHFEVSKNGRTINPKNILKGLRRRSRRK